MFIVQKLELVIWFQILKEVVCFHFAWMRLDMTQLHLFYSSTTDYLSSQTGFSNLAIHVDNF